MKLRTICSLVAIASVSSIVAVGCSAEAPPAADKANVKEEPVQTAPKTDPKTPASKDPKASAPTKPTTTTTTPADTTKPASGTSVLAVCKACLAKSTKGAEFVKCEDACDEKDDACHAKCQDDVCGQDAAKCSADLAKCETECKPAAPTPEQKDAYAKCMAETPKTKTLFECEQTCKDAACDKCWTDSQCETDEACTKQLDKCEGVGG